MITINSAKNHKCSFDCCRQQSVFSNNVTCGTTIQTGEWIGSYWPFRVDLCDWDMKSVKLSWCFNASCQIHGRWSGTITSFLNFFGFPINHHSTIVPYSSVTVSWGVQCSWKGNTLPYPLTLSMGHHSWPGTWLVKEQWHFEGVWTLSFSKFTIYKSVQAHICSPPLWWQNTLNTEHLMFRQIITFLRQVGAHCIQQKNLWLWGLAILGMLNINHWHDGSVWCAGDRDNWVQS
jgi:hypothetical protein